jgi:hypothetical protein
MQVCKRIQKNAHPLWALGLYVIGLSCQSVFAAPSNNESIQLENDEGSFVFAGVCFNGASYRLHLFERHVNGQLQPFYEYTGPAGRGVVASDTPPKVMAARVCRQQAEIISSRYWE